MIQQENTATGNIATKINSGKCAEFSVTSGEI